MKGLRLVMPSRGCPDPEAFRALLAVAAHSKGAVIDFPYGAPRDWNRNRAVKAFLDDPASEWLLFVDDDTTVPADCVEKLLGVGQKIVCGVQPLYLQGIVTVNVAYELPSQTKQVPWRSWWGWNTSAAPHVVSACGFGCVLTHREVWEKITYPWFSEIYESPYGDWPVTEDIHFCRRAKEEGFDVWVHPGVLCGHRKLVDMTDWIPAAMVGLDKVGEQSGNGLSHEEPQGVAGRSEAGFDHEIGLDNVQPAS